MSYLTFKDMPSDVTYLWLNLVSWNDLPNLQSTTKHLYTLISDENAPLWSKYLNQYFPEPYLQPLTNESKKCFFKRCWQCHTHLLNAKHTRSFRMDFCVTAKSISFYNSSVYAIYHQHVEVCNIQKPAIIKKIRVPSVEQFLAYHNSFVTLRRGTIEIRNADCLEIIKTFDCFTAPDNSNIQIPYDHIIFRIHSQFLLTSFWSGPDNWKIKIWPFQGDKEPITLSVGSGRPTALHVKDDFLYVGLDNGKIEVWDLKESELIQVIGTKMVKQGASKIAVDKFGIAGDRSGTLGCYLITRFSDQSEELYVWRLKNGLLGDRFKHQVESTQRVRIVNGLIFSLVHGVFTSSIHIFDPSTKRKSIIDAEVNILDKEYPIVDYYFYEGVLYVVTKNHMLQVFDFRERNES